MNRLRAIYAIMRAGYLNKVRTYRFLVVHVLTIILGYIFVPAADANYVTLGWGSSATFYRGVYDSAWIGALVAMLTGLFLSLSGFYVVKDSVRRDEETRVGQIIATTPIGNPIYTLGNALCNFAVLSTMVAIVFLTALGMQLVRGEDLTVNLWALMAPFLVLVLPLMLLVAALAVLFETRPRLSGGAGNVAYAIVWLIGIPLLFDTIDLFGMNAIISSMRIAGLALYPDLYQKGYILGFSWGFPSGRTLATFPWAGISWTFEILKTRLLSIGLALGISLLASVRFGRFDPARETREVPEALPLDVPDMEEVSPVVPLGDVRLKPLAAKALNFRFGPMLLAEFRLIMLELRDMPIMGTMGFAAAGALILVGIFLPLDRARGMLLPLAWILPVLVWSKMGTRENRHRTEQLVFSSAKSLERQLPAAWLAGVFLAVVTGSGVALNMALHGDWPGVLAWAVGALFIPSLALFLGVWTGSSKSFEFIYTMLWYIGPINRVEPLDFMGVLPGSFEAGIWRLYMVITVVLIGLVLMGRRWQIQRG